MWTEHLVESAFCVIRGPKSNGFTVLFMEKTNKKKSRRDGLFLVSAGKAETEELMGLLNNHFN